MSAMHVRAADAGMAAVHCPLSSHLWQLAPRHPPHAAQQVAQQLVSRWRGQCTTLHVPAPRGDSDGLVQSPERK